MLVERMAARLRDLGAWEEPSRGDEATVLSEDTIARLRDLGYV